MTDTVATFLATAPLPETDVAQIDFNVTFHTAQDHTRTLRTHHLTAELDDVLNTW